MDYKKSWEKAVSKIYDLQEENERLKEALCKDNIVSKNKYDCLKRQKENLELRLSCIKDYKSRNEKAISLLKEAGCYDEETKTFCDDVWEELPELLNILQGEDKEWNYIYG